MSGPVRGQRLFVNVSAAEARRRLAGRGLGVRKIHSGGRHQAVVIHTAEGKHRDELQSIFCDVGWADSEAALAAPIQNLRNIGPQSAEWLREAGLRTIDDLRRVGAAAAYQLVRRRRAGCSLNLLWALAAGLDDRDWRELTDAERDALRRELGEPG